MVKNDAGMGDDDPFDLDRHSETTRSKQAAVHADLIEDSYPPPSPMAESIYLEINGEIEYLQKDLMTNLNGVRESEAQTCVWDFDGPEEAGFSDSLKSARPKPLASFRSPSSTLELTYKQGHRQSASGAQKARLALKMNQAKETPIVRMREDLADTGGYAASQESLDSHINVRQHESSIAPFDHYVQQQQSQEQLKVREIEQAPAIPPRSPLRDARSSYHSTSSASTQPIEYKGNWARTPSSTSRRLSRKSPHPTPNDDRRHTLDSIEDVYDYHDSVLGARKVLASPQCTEDSRYDTERQKWTGLRSPPPALPLDTCPPNAGSAGTHTSGYGRSKEYASARTSTGSGTVVHQSSMKRVALPPDQPNYFNQSASLNRTDTSLWLQHGLHAAQLEQHPRLLLLAHRDELVAEQLRLSGANKELWYQDTNIAVVSDDSEHELKTATRGADAWNGRLMDPADFLNPYVHTIRRPETIWDVTLEAGTMSELKQIETENRQLSKSRKLEPYSLREVDLVVGREVDTLRGFDEGLIQTREMYSAERTRVNGDANISHEQRMERRSPAEPFKAAKATGIKVRYYHTSSGT